MTSRNKVADVEREERYGYVFGVSGPGLFSFTATDRDKERNTFLVVVANRMAGAAINELVN